MKYLAVIVAVLLVLSGAFAYNAFVAYVEPYHSVSQVVDNSEAFLNRKVQVIGTVVNGSTKYGSDGLLNFSLTDGNSTIDVVYRGEPVSNFVEGQQSVAVGELVSSQKLQASQILVKCPSKYESQDQTSLFSSPIFPIAILLGTVAIGFSVVSITLSKRKDDRV